MYSIAFHFMDWSNSHSCRQAPQTHSLKLPCMSDAFVLFLFSCLSISLNCVCTQWFPPPISLHVYLQCISCTTNAVHMYYHVVQVHHDKTEWWNKLTCYVGKTKPAVHNEHWNSVRFYPPRQMVAHRTYFKWMWLIHNRASRWCSYHKSLIRGKYVNTPILLHFPEPILMTILYGSELIFEMMKILLSNMQSLSRI